MRTWSSDKASARAAPARGGRHGPGTHRKRQARGALSRGSGGGSLVRRFRENVATKMSLELTFMLGFEGSLGLGRQALSQWAVTLTLRTSLVLMLYPADPADLHVSGAFLLVTESTLCSVIQLLHTSAHWL